MGSLARDTKIHKQEFLKNLFFFHPLIDFLRQENPLSRYLVLKILIALGLSFLVRDNHIPEVNITHFIDKIVKSSNSTCKNKQFLHQKLVILFF